MEATGDTCEHGGVGPLGAPCPWRPLLHALQLETDDFDGLNNLFEIPFALPWFLLPIGGIWSHQIDAWIAAGMGWLNALLILLFLHGCLATTGARRTHN
jgi:hypothetical protein